MTPATSRMRAAAARRWGAQPRFLRFLLAAGASVPVNIASRIVFSHWLPFEIAVVLSHVVGMLTAYALTRRWVFERSGRPVRSELVRFAGVNVVSAAITWCVSVGLVDLVFPWLGVRTQPELIGHVAGLAVSSAASFLGHARFSFARR